MNTDIQKFGNHFIEVTPDKTNGLPEKAFCLVCGNLKIVKGNILHPSPAPPPHS